MVRVGISGSRTIIDKDLVFSTLNFYLSRFLEDKDNLTIVHGNAIGVDYLANDWAQEKGLKQKFMNLSMINILRNMHPLSVISRL